jgi:site-specific recombinase XerD
MFKMWDKMSDTLNMYRYSERTIQNYLQAVNQLSHHYGRAPRWLSSKQVYEFMLHRYRQGISPSGLRILRSGIRFFYRNVLGNDIIMKSIPTIKWKRKIPVVMSTAEVRKLVRAASTLKEKVIIMLLYSTGIRLGELLQIRRKDIDLSRKLIKINGKGNRERYVPLSKVLWKYLKLYYKEYRPVNYLFFYSVGKPYHGASIRNLFKETKRRAGIEKPGGPHLMRHTFATHLVEAEVPIYIIQKLMGHACIETTARYLWIANNRIMSVQNPLDRLLPGETKGVTKCKVTPFKFTRKCA